jgi:CheY-like chemotaxis protein
MKNISILYLYGECYSELTFDKLEKEDKTIRQIAFPPNSSESIDQLYHNQLKRILNKSFDLIITELNYNENDFLDFSGLRVAMHVRLTPEFNNQKTPILVLGFASFDDIIRLESCNNSFLGSILGTPGLTLSQDIKLEKELPSSNLCEKDFQYVLRKIKIEPPPNYDNRHSVANEYAIYSWSKAIGLENEEIEKEHLSTLYFKYQDCINQNNQNEDSKDEDLKIIAEKGTKILLIDDESEKGWNHFYKELLGDDVILIVPEIKFNADSCEIKKKVIQIIKVEDPDIVLLDLRLSEDDTGKVSGLTGVQIINELDKDYDINRGIRVIITSASNKIWNYLDAGIRSNEMIDSVIIKSTEAQNNKHPIDNIIMTLNDSIKRSRFLKTKYNQLKDLILKLKVYIPDEKLSHLTDQIYLCFSLLVQGITSIKHLNFAYIVVYQILEGAINSGEFFEEKESDFFIFCNGEKVRVRKKDISKKEQDYVLIKLCKYNKAGDPIISSISQPKLNYSTTKYIVDQLLIFRFSASNEIKRWTTLNQLRNNLAVHGQFSSNDNISEENIENLLEFTALIFNAKKQNDENIKFGFKNPCTISLIEVYSQYSIDSETETYSQELKVNHCHSLAKKTSIIINGQHFDLKTSPQIMKLENMPSDGKEVNIKAQIEGEEVKVEFKLFTAPKSEEKKLSDRDKIKEAKKKYKESLNSEETD